MAEKDQVEENGKGGDVVDGNSQGGKKGKKGPDLLLPQIWQKKKPQGKEKGVQRKKIKDKR